MKMRGAAPVAAMTILFSTGLAAQTTGEANTDETETILVTGEGPGPGLWKVSKGENVLWILGNYGMLPKGMVWRSREVEARVAESQEILYPGGTSIGADIGLFKALALIPAALKASRNPDGATLRDLLTPQAYEKWLVIRKKYLDDDKGVEKRRPIVITEQLNNAVPGRGERGDSGVMWAVNNAANKHKVPIHRLPSIERKFDFGNIRKMLKESRKLDFSEAECFTTNLDRIEPFVEAWKVGANAWALGDIDTLRSAMKTPRLIDCSEVAMNGLRDGTVPDIAGARATLERLDAETKSMQNEWEQTLLAAAETALASNRSTFAVLDLDYVLAPEGFVKLMLDRGYTVEEPQ